MGDLRGGTTLYQLGPPPIEGVWNESRNETGAGGGGISTSHVMPSYQADAPAALQVVNADSSGAPCHAIGRTPEVPDVSADADPYTGYLVYFAGKWSGIGGTSAAAPLWAAFAALADASSACVASLIGFANPALYDAASIAYSADFNDITSGNNDYSPLGYVGGRTRRASASTWHGTRDARRGCPRRHLVHHDPGTSRDRDRARARHRRRSPTEPSPRRPSPSP